MEMPAYPQGSDLARLNKHGARAPGISRRHRKPPGNRANTALDGGGVRIQHHGSNAGISQQSHQE